MKRWAWTVCLLLLSAQAGQAMDLKPLVYSFFVPGLGEWSLGYRGRAVAHWTLEAGCWAGNFYYREQGFDQRHEYEAYADEHWHTARWASAFNEERPDWLNWISDEEWTANAWGALQPTAVEFDETHEGYLQSHFAPFHEDPQHYYENLGKYDWYRWGWDDYSAANDRSEHRYVYLNMRNDSDDSFRRAHKFITVLILGRMVSLVDTYVLLHRMESGASRAEIERSWRLTLSPIGRDGAGFRLGLTRSW